MLYKAQSEHNDENKTKSVKNLKKIRPLKINQSVIEKPNR